jgi:hypothetical protein
MTSARNLARLDKLIWVLAFGGLFLLTLGLATLRYDAATGWVLVVVGGVVAAAGFVLIWVRSRMSEPPPT